MSTLVDLLGALTQPLQGRVQCVTRDTVTGRILQIGGVASNGMPFRYTEAQAIAMIRAGTHQFYTLENGVKAEVEVVGDPFSQFAPFLKTVPDSLKPNNLVSLPDCQ